MKLPYSFVTVVAAVAVCPIIGASAPGKGSSTITEKFPSSEAVAALRARGPDGLEVAIARYDLLMKELTTLNVEEQGNKPQALAAWRDAIDQISAQRSGNVSRLYWYTDWDAARAAAERTGRPILSLRMLGKLTDEYSCANSRFFRTALYANQEISDYLRDHFVLHWQSVRPVPRVTIDFGDGRKLERTVTGNSAHYIVTASGQPLDVLPGLYSPQLFQWWLTLMKSFHDDYQAVDAAERPSALQSFHARRRDEILYRWDEDIERLGGTHAEIVRVRINSEREAARLAGDRVNDPPDAAAAASRAVVKTAGEAPVLRFAKFGGAWIERGMNEEIWQAIANLHRQQTKLDEASIGLMRNEFPPATDAGKLAVGKYLQEDPVLRMVRMFEDSIAIDTVRNEYLLHRRVHERFAADGPTAVADIDALNEWVYAELFLTPSSDPWLGLAPRDVYTALDRGGQFGAVENRLSGRSE